MSEKTLRTATKDEKAGRRRRWLPFLMTAVLLAVDQLSKAWVVANMPLGEIYRKYFGDFIWLWHVRNTGAAFSLGAGGGDFVRVLLFIVLPLAVMGFLAWAIVSPRSRLTTAQRWFCAGILGGGLGTIWDRVFRFSEGVVDFISIRFYGLFGLERWPTFNLSDSYVVIFVILLAFSLVFEKKAPENKEAKK